MMADLLLTHGSYLGIILFLVLTGCGLPIPEEVPVVTAGVLAAQGGLHPLGGFLACLIGALLGDSVMYAIGYHWGHSLLKAHPRFARFLHAEREEKFERMIRRHGMKVLFVARFMIGVRSPVYLSTGILRIPFRRFLLTDLFCATAVVGTFYWLTYAFGEHIASWLRQAELGLTSFILLAILAVAAFFYYRRRQRLARFETAKTERTRRNRLRQERKLDQEHENDSVPQEEVSNKS
jgi:membrane protein DedA with SNARE-associated domain